MDGERAVGQFACTFDKNAVMSNRLHNETEEGGTKPKIYSSSAGRSAYPCTTE